MVFAGALSGLFRLLMKQGNSFRMRRFGLPMKLFTTQLLIRYLNFITNFHNDFNFGINFFFLVALGVFWCWILRKIEVEIMVKCLLEVLVFIIRLLFMLWILSLDSSGNFLMEIEFESQLMFGNHLWHA
jgi:hypothetical protein